MGDPQCPVGAASLVTGLAFLLGFVAVAQRGPGLRSCEVAHPAGSRVAGLDSVFEALARDANRDLKGVVVVRRGCITAERYFNGDDAGTLHDIRSAAKSITSTLVGIAIGRGLIPGVDVPVAGLLPPGAPDRVRRIRVRDLLTMQSGLDSYDRDSVAAGNERWLDASDDWIRFAYSVPQVSQAGERYVYSSLTAFLAGAIVEHVTHSTLQTFAGEALFRPLGIDRWAWRVGPRGEGTGQGNLSIRARDLAAFGELFLRGGVFQGRRIVDSAWVRAALAPKVAIGATDKYADGYGYMWYSKRYERPGRAVTVRFASGNGGNKVYLVPDRDLVIAVTSSAYGLSRGQARSERILLGILDAVEPGAVPAR